MLEGEVLHVAVDALQLAVLEDREPDVQDTVLVLRVLHDQEEAEVASLKMIVMMMTIRIMKMSTLTLTMTCLAFMTA